MSVVFNTVNLPRDVVAERTLRDGSFVLKLVFTTGPHGRVLCRAETPTGEILAEGANLAEANAEGVRALTVIMEDWLLALWGAAPFAAIRNAVALLIQVQGSEDIHAEVERVTDLLARALPSVAAPQPLSGLEGSRLDRGQVHTLLGAIVANRGMLNADQIGKKLLIRLTRLTPDQPTVVYVGLAVVLVSVGADGAPLRCWPVDAPGVDWPEYGMADLQSDGSWVVEDYQMEFLL